MMPHEFRPWTPPPGAVVDPPVHPETTVKTFWSDDDFSEILPAGEFAWSADGDGPRVVAYAVVREYKPEPVLREWWFTFDNEGFDDDIVVLHESHAAADDGRRDGYGRIRNHGEVIRVREVPDPSREVVAWAVVFGGQHVGTWTHEESARQSAKHSGGTVVRLTGVMP